MRSHHDVEVDEQKALFGPAVLCKQSKVQWLASDTGHCRCRQPGMVNVLIWKWISLCTFLTRFLYGADLAWDSRASREYKISPIFVQFPQPLLPNNFNIFESSKYLQSLPSHHAFPHRIHPCSRCRLHISLSRWSPKRQQSPR